MFKMKISFIIYCRAVGIYALLSLPLLVEPFVYFISLIYVLMYGWFAFAVFSLMYFLLNKLIFDFVLKLVLLFISVIIAVGFAYYMIGVMAMGDEIRQPEFLIYPFGAVIAGWISVCLSSEKIRSSCYPTENEATV
jgi:hypothetical protein